MKTAPRSAAIANKQPKLSRDRAPTGVSVVEWQRGLRRQFGRAQAFRLENLGKRAFLFGVSGQQSRL